MQKELLFILKKIFFFQNTYFNLTQLYVNNLKKINIKWL